MRGMKISKRDNSKYCSKILIIWVLRIFRLIENFTWLSAIVFTWSGLVEDEAMIYSVNCKKKKDGKDYFLLQGLNTWTKYLKDIE